MTVCFSDGFDSYAATADLKNKWAMAAPTWVFSTAADQNGATGGIVSATNSYLSPLATQTGLLSGTRCGFGFWLKISALPGFNQAIFRADSVNGTGCIRLGIITTGVLWMISGDGGSGIMTGTINVCNNAWHWIELAGQIGTNVNQRLLVDGTSEYNTNATVQSAAITYDHAMFYSVDQRVISLSDVVMINNTSPVTVAADFPLGARKIITKRPDADDIIQFTRSSGSTSYTLIDEVAGDLTDYVESGTPSTQDFYDYAALGVTPSSVNAVVVNTYMTTSVPGVVTCEQLAKSVGVIATGPTIVVPPSPFTLQQAFHIDPNGSIAWTEAGVNAAKFGIRVTGGFVPSDIGSTWSCAWYSAKDTSSITHSSGLVTQWNDKSGNNNHLIQSGAARPTTGVDTLNGYNVLTFGGSHTLVKDGSIVNVPDGGTFTGGAIIVLRKITSGTSAGLLWISRGAAGSYGDVMGVGRDAGNMGVWGRDTLSSVGNAAQYADSDNTNWHISSGRYTDSERSIREDGTVKNTNVVSTGVTGGALMIVGQILAQNRATNLFLTGQIAEVVVISDAYLPFVEMVEGWMAWTYGLQGQLAVGHPYKSAPP